MHRRDFILKSTAITAYTCIGGLLSCTEKTKQITILHTNDTHSHIDAFSKDHPLYANKGGVAKRATLVNAIRAENPNTLLLDAGDIFQGTPYFNYYGGALEIKLMSMLQYDAATLGNHDFDNGIAGFYKQLPHANFSFLSANYDFRNTLLNTHVKPYKIFNKQGVRIGVFGLGVKLKGLVDPKLYLETKYIDPLDIAQEYSHHLKKQEKCDIIICLSHLGYYYKKFPDRICDLHIAKNTEYIDLIIGGHTHTFLPKPTVIKNRKQQNTLVNQVGAYGVHLGRIDFFLDNQKNKQTKTSLILS